MTRRRLAATAALGLLVAAGPGLAQQADDFRPVTPESNWLIADNGCRLDGGWGDDIAITIARHDDHHDLGVYDPAFENLKPEKVIPVRFGAGGQGGEVRGVDALGHRGGKQKSYVAAVDDALLDAFANAGSLQFYRGDVLEIDLDMVGFPAALAAMRACESAQSAEPVADEVPAAAADAAADAMVDEAPAP